MTTKNYALPAGSGSEQLVLFSGTISGIPGDWEPVTLVNSDGSLVETSGLLVKNAAQSVQIDYGTRTDGNPIYLGTFTPGVAIGNLKQFTYDTKNRATQILNATDLWANRATTAVYS